MSSSSHANPDGGTPFIILGADAVLAALPASPVQLAHACQALGFQLAAPATWGDELIAESCLDQLAGYEHPSAVMCSCPLVTERLTRASTSLEPFMLTFTSPPVATARYLRAAFGGQALHITYAGSCPGADDDSIDARLRPADLLDAFLEHGIVIGEQPNCFDALIPLDRRRFYSLPGGTPTAHHVERVAHRTLIELTGDDVVLELTQQLIEQTPALLDLAMPLGCACAGAGEHSIGGNPRARLLTLEPPRARQRVLDQSVQIDVTQTLIEACEHRAIAAEEPAVLEVVLAADAAPTSVDVVEIVDVGDVDLRRIELGEMDLGDLTMNLAEMRASVFVEAVSDSMLADAPVFADPVFVEPVIELRDEAIATPEEPVNEITTEEASSPFVPARRRQVVVRPASSIPRHAKDDGAMVPRASLAVLRRALARNATRKARHQPKVERGRRDRTIELREGLSRSVVRTPRSLAIAASDLPRPVPPPPARHRLRTLLEM